MRKRAIPAVFVVLGMVVLATAAAPAEAVLHLKLDKSTPEADQVVTTTPDKLLLDFSEKPEVAVSRVAVSGEHGAVKLTDPKLDEQDESILWVAFEEPLGDGAYSVSWTTSSDDGHPVRGEFSFTVRAGR